MNDNRCVCCGQVMPEGTQVCQNCQHEAFHRETREERAERILWDWVFPLLIPAGILAAWLIWG